MELNEVMETEQDTELLEGTEEDTSTESLTEQTEEDATEESTSAEDDNTEDSEEQTDEVSAEGKAIPYARFKQVNEAKNLATEKAEQLEAQLEEIRQQLKDPKMLKALQEHYAPEATAASATSEATFEELSKDLDLNNAKDWFRMMQRVNEQAISQKLAPLEAQVSQAQFSRIMDSQKREAELFCKARDIEYGDENNVSSPDTGVSKIANYLNANPQKRTLVAGGQMTKLDVLKLALVEEGVNFGVAKGVILEKTRQKKLKNASMEAGSRSGRSEQPDSSWDVSRLLKWSRENPQDN